jgi:membrane protease YdiL (CAAX protease family)
MEMAVFGIFFGLAFFLSHVSVEELLLRWRGIIRPLWQGAAYAVALPFVIWFLITSMFLILTSLGLVARYQMIDIGAASHRGVERLVSSSDLQHDRLFFWLSSTLVSFVFAGLREELWRSAFFAGIKALWLQSFESPLGKVWGAALAAIVFGFAHTLMGPLAVLNAGLGGFGLGLIIMLHRSIWPAVIAHGLHDAVNVAMMVHPHA